MDARLVVGGAERALDDRQRVVAAQTSIRAILDSVPRGTTVPQLLAAVSAAPIEPGRPVIRINRVTFAVRSSQWSVGSAVKDRGLRWPPIALSWPLTTRGVKVPAHFPLAPLGGLYIATVGACLVAGAVVARLRTASAWIGLGLGIVAVAVLSRRLVPAAAPTAFQIGALVAAIVVEFVAFPMIMPRVRPRGERAVAVATLAIVGAHFTIMVPALGPLAGILGLACVANATGLARLAGYGVRAAWAADGVIKVALGTAMVAAAG